MRLTSTSHAAQFSTPPPSYMMQSSLYQLLPSFPSALPQPPQLHSSAHDEQEIMTARPRAASANHLANTVAMKTVSSNHAAADQVFRSITTLPHLHINFFCCVVHFDIVWCCLAVWSSNLVENVRVVPEGEDAPSVAPSGLLMVMFPFLSILSVGSWKQHRDTSSPVESAVSKNSLYTRTATTNYIEAESPHLPGDLDHSLGIAREEVPQNCLFDPISHKYRA